MDRALWLLLALRAKGWARRWARNARTLKGTLLAVVGALLFLPALLTVFLLPRVQLAEQSALIRRFGPIGLLGYCLLNVLLSSGERAVYYSPAEVNYLFSSAFRLRQLLLYKAAANLPAILLTAAFFTLTLQHHAPLPVAVFIGLFLALELLFLFSIAVSLFVSVVGAVAFNRRRKVLLVATIALILAALAPLARSSDWGATDVLRLLDESPVMNAAVAPFRPFILTFTAERVWPDLVVHALAAAAIDLVLLAMAIGLNLQFLEASARSSARRYELLLRARRGAAWAEPRSVRVRLPMLPWAVGVGPNLWRQLTTAARSLSRTGAVLVLFTCPLLVLFVVSPGTQQDLQYQAITILASLAVFAPTVIGYDFRPDLGRMEELKTLPIRPSALVIAQLLTPASIISVGHWVGVALVVSRIELPRVVVIGLVLVAPPLNFLLVGIENVFFLWFPTRFIAGATADFQMMGRQFLLMMARLLCALFAIGLATGLGAFVFLAGGESWTGALAAGWFGLAAAGAGLVPLAAQAFRDFDVARERLE